MSDTQGAAAPRLHEQLQGLAGDHREGAYRPRRGNHLDRFERGGHVDPQDLLSGRLTPDGKAVRKADRARQADLNREWMAEEHDRLTASRAEPLAYAQNSYGSITRPVGEDEVDRILRTRAGMGNADEEFETKSRRAQEYAARLASQTHTANTEESQRRIREPRRADFLPVSRDDMEARGWEQCDFILITGDAYVDHPSFANGVLARVLEWAGFKIGIIAQPGWKGLDDVRRLGRPRLAFLVSAGNLDSLLNAYTAHKLPRSEDAYSPGGRAGCRPNRATIVYCNLIRQAFGKVPILIGGIEASQRRFSHYDYWDDSVRRSILLDSNADMLVFGMGEVQLVEIAHRLNLGEKIREINDVRGTTFVRKDASFLASPVYIERFGPAQFNLSHEELLPPKGVAPDRVQELQSTEIPAYRRNYARAFKFIYDEQDPVRGRPVVQKTGALHVIQLPPSRLETDQELDRWFDLPYTRAVHPDHERDGGVPAWKTTQHTIVTHRGCMGSCTFCAIWMHQGRTIQSRSQESIVAEAEKIAAMPEFKGYISDVGGPTANMYGNFCTVQQSLGGCKDRDCLLPDPCPALRQHLGTQLEMLRKVREVPGVKKAFIASGIRHDMLIDEKTAGEAGNEYIRNLAEHHTSGYLKTAPEHLSDEVLALMRKPAMAKHEEFKRRFQEASKKLGKEQYIVSYFISSHPGCTMDEQIALAEYFKRNNWSPEQVQDFIPTPMTPATAMFYSGYDPETMQRVYTPTTMREKRRQRALMQFNRPEFKGRVRKALREAGRKDLIGRHQSALVTPGNEEDWQDRRPRGKKRR